MVKYLFVAACRRIADMLAKNSETSAQSDEACDYPVKELGNYVGNVISVRYINAGAPKTTGARTVLVCPPNHSCFLVGKKDWYFAIHWDDKNFELNKRNATVSIEDAHGNLIYVNEEVAKLYEQLERETKVRGDDAPTIELYRHLLKRL